MFILSLLLACIHRILYQNGFLSKLKLFWDSLLLCFECESTIHLVTLICIYTSIFLKQDQIFLKIALKHLLYIMAILDDFANSYACLYEFWSNENHFDEIHRIIEWLKLEEILMIIWVHPSYLGQGCYRLDQADHSTWPWLPSGMGHPHLLHNLFHSLRREFSTNI